MSIVGILPTLLLGLAFIGIGLLLWRKRRLVALAPIVIGLMLCFFGINVYSNVKARKRATRDYQTLVRELNRPDFAEFLVENDDDETVYLLSLASHALYKTSERFPSQRNRVMPILAEHVKYISDDRRFPLWRTTRNWKENAFFLAHAGIIMGHYQDLSKDESFSDRFRKVGGYLAKALPNARYKNLISHPKEDIMRPADNAAALYAISLHDRYYATEYAPLATDNWLEYLARELEYSESHLPCAGFTETNRCKLDPTASSLGMMLAYLSEVGVNDQQLYREWLHYFKLSNLSPLSLDFNSGMRSKADPRFCDLANYPLSCAAHLPEIGAWLAAGYGGDYTYNRLMSRRLLTSDKPFNQQLQNRRPLRRREVLTTLALRVLAGME